MRLLEVLCLVLHRKKKCRVWLVDIHGEIMGYTLIFADDQEQAEKLTSTHPLLNNMTVLQ